MPPVWYLEDGFQTASPLAAYRGTETERKPVSEDVQAAQLTRAVQLADCRPGVTAFFNFELRDDADRAGWRSGLLRPDWTAKPVAAVRHGTVDRSQVHP